MPEYMPSQDNNTYSEINRWSKLFRWLGNLGKRLSGIFTVIDNPAIINSVSGTRVGNAMFIYGLRFGIVPGEIRLHSSSGNALNIVLLPNQWTDTLIQTTIPETIQGIGYNHRVNLTVSTAEAGSPHLEIIVDPKDRVWKCEKNQSYDGTKTPGYDYHEIKEINSALLPVDNMIFQNFGSPGSDTHRGPVSLSSQFWQRKVSGVAIDSFGTARIKSDPQVIGEIGDQRIKARIEVKDDYHWDYKITVNFFIWMPLGFHPPAGWE